jgi:CubicO group peptidase (beta-lactamase class C family)
MLNLREDNVVQNLLEPRYIRRQGFRSASLIERMQSHGIPGVSVAVIRDFALDWAAGFGVCEAGGARPVTDTTMFQACSISKVVAATGIMRLVQDGVLDLDEDVNRYLTSWKLPPNGNFQPRVTLRQLLSHSAGVTVHGFVGYNRNVPTPTLLQVLEGESPANTGPIRVDHLPGTRYRYSGGGFTIVQQLVEDVLGRPFTEAMQDLVLRPLGMAHSTFAQPLPDALWAAAASGHTSGGGVLDGKWHVQPETAAGGLWTTPTDLARLTIEVQSARAGRPSKLLSERSADQMLLPNPGGCGLGFHLDGMRFNHGGDNVGFKCSLVAYQDHGLGVVVMTNADQGWHVVNELIRAVSVAYDWPLDAANDYPFYPTPEHPPAPVPADRLASCVGDYELRPDYIVRVRNQGGQLWLDSPDQPTLPLTAASAAEFDSEHLNLRVTFADDRAAATLRLDGEPFRMRRLI